MTNPTTITAPPGTPFIDITREFDATPAQVFRAATDPELVSRWLGPRGYEIAIDEYDVRPGGRYRYRHRDPAGPDFAFRGVFHTIEPDHLVVQTFEYEGVPGVVSLETATYTDLGDGRTRLHTHSVFPTVEARDGMIEAGMEHGVNDAMDRLTELLDEGEGEGAATNLTGRARIEITMSLDGFVTAAGADAEHGLGVGGEALHNWVFQGTARDTELLEENTARTGAVIMGRNTFDVIDGPGGWGDEVGYAGPLPDKHVPPVFVVTHTAPEKWRLGGRIRFVTDGIESALRQAKAAAGDKEVVIMGGGDLCGQYLAAGLADTLVLHVAPMVLGSGTPLFVPGAPVDLKLLHAESSPAAQHLTYALK
jgi:uncharacterized protein YndB with AHSA1/START domain/dihydrofolate reductase